MTKTQILERLDIRAFYQGLIPGLHLPNGGKPEATATCPFHDDKRPSLSVNLSTGLYHCFSCGAKGDVFTFYQKLKQVNFITAMKEIADMQGINEPRQTLSKVVAKFQYKDSTGRVCYVKQRIEPGRDGRKKEFLFLHPEGQTWQRGRGCDPVPYNLASVMAAKEIFVVEGEGKVDFLAKWGLIGTSLDSGANSPWRSDYLPFFQGKWVTIIPDNDPPGDSYADNIARALFGHVTSLKICKLPGLEMHDDIVDWAKNPANTKEKLATLIENIPEYSPPSKQSKKIELTSLRDLFNEPEEAQSWLVDELLPTGGFSLLVGKPKSGKSTLARNLALQVARGEDFLGRSVEPGEVIYLALEEKRKEVTKHFRAMGATGQEPIFVFASTAPADGVKQLYDLAKEKQPALIIVDPLFRLTRVKDGNDYAQMTQALEPLLTIARETGSHVMLIHHAKKGGGQDGDSILGSSAIFASVDSALFLKRSERYRTLSSQQRYGEDLEEIILSFDSETRQTLAGGSKEDVETDRVKIGILKFLETQPGPATEKEINEGVEGKTIIQRKALRELFSEEKILRSGRGGRHDPFHYTVKNSSCSDVPCIYVGTSEHNEEKAAKTSNDGFSTCSQAFAKNETLDEKPGTRRNAGNKYIDLEQGVDFLTVEGGANV